MKSKKRPFFILILIFGVITVFSLFYNWGSSPFKTFSTMMNQSMGNMMSGMHLESANLSDVIKQNQNLNITQKADNMSGHHDENNGLLKVIHDITTGSIVLLIPFIIAGAVFLGIVWLK